MEDLKKYTRTRRYVEQLHKLLIELEGEELKDEVARISLRCLAHLKIVCEKDDVYSGGKRRDDASRKANYRVWFLAAEEERRKQGLKLAEERRKKGLAR
jgi:hypothetical protein